MGEEFLVSLAQHIRMAMAGSKSRIVVCFRIMCFDDNTAIYAFMRRFQKTIVVLHCNCGKSLAISVTLKPPPVKLRTLFLLFFACITATLPLRDGYAQHTGHADHSAREVEAQPLLAQALRLEEALRFLGSALSEEDSKRLKALADLPASHTTSRGIQDILDSYCLAVVSINPEARVKVSRGLAPAQLIQGGWTSFLVKVYNDAGVRAQLEVESPHGLAPIHAPSWHPKVKAEDVITPGQATNRFLDLEIYRNRPLLPHLSGLAIEYAVVQIYAKDAGKREAEIGFHVGQG